MRTYPFYILSVLLIVLFFSSPAAGSQVEDQSSYHQWLKRYGAIDIYAMSVRERKSGPEGQLEYANALISMGNHEAALTVIQEIQVAQDPDLEGRKLWIRHRALRQMGQFDQAVLSVIEASSLLGNQQMAVLMNKEPGLDHLWSNVWKKWYFQTLGPALINEGRRTIMEQSVLLARAAWPEHKMWSDISIPLSGSERLPETPGLDQIQIARALAMWSIGHWTKADEALAQVGNQHKRNFFANLGRFLRDSGPSSWDSELNSLKSNGFVRIYHDHLHTYALNSYLLTSPEVGSWDAFLDRIKSLPVSGAVDLLNRELSSALLSDDVRGRLEALRFVFELQNTRHDQAKSAWQQAVSASPSLPFTLYLSYALIARDIENIAGLPSSRYPFFREILNAAGFNPDPGTMSDFWASEPGQINRLYSAYPLDYAINFLFYSKAFEEGKSQSAARNLAFLFPYSEQGQSAYLELARIAYRGGNKTLAWRYLQNISQEFAQGPRQMELLEAKAGILMDMGREDESLLTYMAILEKEPHRLSHERRLRLALLAQEKHEWAMAQEMLEALWEERSQVPAAIQAEVLFWLGEGAQYQGDLEKALDYYLRLSWQFPEQNIWAVTAMYRAGLIYEQRGMLDTARNLFQTVLRNAGRQSQKEAAQQRLDAIDAVLGSPGRAESFLF